MKMKSFALIAACLCQPLLAGTPAEKENEIKRMREKEQHRASEAAAIFANREDFEKKYESMKEDFPTQFAAAVEKRQLAAKAWKAAADGIAGANSYEQLYMLKAPAYDAEGAAELARLELKAAAAEREWKRSAEKSDSRQVTAAAEQLIQNQKAFMQASRQNLTNQKALRQLEIQRSILDRQMRNLYESARRDQQEKREEKDKQSSRNRGDKDKHSPQDHEKKNPPNHNNDLHNDKSDKPGEILVE